MSSAPSTTTRAYGSARDLPSFREMSDQLRVFKGLTRIVFRSKRSEIIQLERGLDRLASIVDQFYEVLGPRNWVFHDMLSVDRIEALLRDSATPEDAEAELVRMYQDPEATQWWITRLNGHEGLRARLHQIEQARHHYDAGEFDSCTLHLIAVMDGFVNDFQPQNRKGLHAREADEMVAWDSVAGHHLGLSHVMVAFRKSFQKRTDDEVFELHRNGIVHGTIARFDNEVVATKAWNMLFAVADWANATTKASKPTEPDPSWRELLGTLAKRGEHDRQRKSFTPRTLTGADPDFNDDVLVGAVGTLLGAWEHGRWAHLLSFQPPVLRRGDETDGQAAKSVKEVFSDFPLSDWTIVSVEHDMLEAGNVRVEATIRGESVAMTIRLVSYDAQGNVAPPAEEGATWKLAMWGPDLYLRAAA